MAYTLRIPESSVYGKKKFVNKKGNTECVEFVQQVTGAPTTLAWRNGIKVKDASQGAIPRGLQLLRSTEMENTRPTLRGDMRLYIFHTTNKGLRCSISGTIRAKCRLERYTLIALKEQSEATMGTLSM
jgi:hypothetical protein